MKIRTDFVSNSSSSSFIVSSQGSYSIHDFSKQMANNITEKGENKNETITKLEFMLSNFAALFIGGFETGDIEFHRRIGAKEVDVNKYFGSFSSFPILMDKLQWWYTVKQCKHEYNQETGRYDELSEEDAEKNLIDKILKMCISREEVPYDILYNPQCFQITRESLDNTVLLKKHGYKIDVEDEYINKMYKALDDGNKIYNICVSYEGDGNGANQIYCSKDPIMDFCEKMPVQNIMGID